MTGAYSERVVRRLEQAYRLDPENEGILRAAWGGSPPAWVRSTIFAMAETRRGLRRLHTSSVADARQRACVDLAYLDLSVLYANDLRWMAADRSKRRKSALWSHPGGFALFESFMASFINSELALAMLLTAGLTNPARAVFRQQMEYADLVLLCLHDEEFFVDYFRHFSREPRSKREREWKMSSGRVRQRLRERLDALKGSTGVTEKLFESWRSRYSRLSDHVHGRPRDAARSTFDLLPGSRKVAPVLGGRFGLTTLKLIQDIEEHHWGFFMLVNAALAHIHRWHIGPSLDGAIVLSHRVALEQLFVCLSPDANRDALRKYRANRGGAKRARATELATRMVLQKARESPRERRRAR